MIQVTRWIAIDPKEIQEHFVRASGPGGQNVNKVSTAVCLRFDVCGSGSLPGYVKDRLVGLSGKRMTRDGVLVIRAERYRSLYQNRRDARARLVHLIALAAKRVPVRKPTRPTRSSIRRRLDTKRRRGMIKGSRRSVYDDMN